MAESFLAMGEKAVGLAHHEHEQSRKLVASFEAPFKVRACVRARRMAAQSAPRGALPFKVHAYIEVGRASCPGEGVGRWLGL